MDTTGDSHFCSGFNSVHFDQRAWTPIQLDSLGSVTEIPRACRFCVLSEALDIVGGYQDVGHDIALSGHR